MKPSAALIGALAISCISCGSKPMTPGEVVKNIDALNGRTVTVAGYLGRCSGFDCILFSDAKQAAGAHDWQTRFMSALRSHEPPPEQPPSLYSNVLAIGASDWKCTQHQTKDCAFEFDRKAAPFQNSYVLITGRVFNKCRLHGQPACLDRGSDIFPTDIEPWEQRANG